MKGENKACMGAIVCTIVVGFLLMCTLGVMIGFVEEEPEKEYIVEVDPRPEKEKEPETGPEKKEEPKPHVDKDTDILVEIQNLYYFDDIFYIYLDEELYGYVTTESGWESTVRLETSNDKIYLIEVYASTTWECKHDTCYQGEKVVVIFES